MQPKAKRVFTWDNCFTKKGRTENSVYFYEQKKATHS